jgi:glutamine cyclotransferase/nitroreductase
MSHHPKIAATDHDVIDLIRHRWSPRAFDASRPLTRGEQHQLFEAARWASSSGNEQPWQFLAVDRFEHPEAFAKMLSALTETNQSWAKSAPVLVLVSTRPNSADGKPNRYAWYDTGQAVSLLTIQATSMGLGLRQMAGFNRDRAREVCELESLCEPVVAIAIGHVGDAETLPLPRHRETETQPRARRKISEFVKWMTVIAGLAVSLGSAAPSAISQATPKNFGYRVVRTYPHDKTSFTQGLIFRDGFLYESAGDYARSNVRKVDLATGKVLQQTKLADSRMFAEGLTDWQDSLVQLTWQHGQGFVYDTKLLSFKQSFRYSGEGWGLTNDGKRLIMSDGVAASGLRFFDPSTFIETGKVIVRDNGAAVAQLNELEFVEGEVFANVWMTDRIARINPSTGAVTGWIDLRGLLKPGEVSAAAGAVLNGIAYDRATKRLFVTGKLWPKLFEITLVPK